MMPGLNDLSRQIAREYRQGAHLALLFDYDGTLAPFADDPAQALLPLRTRTALEWLARLPFVHVGIISGRQLSDLKAIVAIDGLFLAGTNGLELDFSGLSVRHPRAADSAVDLIRLGDILMGTVSRFPGAWLEKKRLGLTLHYRRLGRHRQADLRALVSQYVEACTHSFVVHEGAAAFEIVPRLGWSKGTAVSMFLNSINAASKVALYAGDNSNDHEAMAIVFRNGGTTIGVGSDAPRCASHVIPATEHLEAFLVELATLVAAYANGPSGSRSIFTNGLGTLQAPDHFADRPASGTKSNRCSSQ